jgi:ubiquilin
MAEMIRNPEMRRLLFNPDMMRMQLQMQQAMGGGQRMTAPGTTDTTPQPDNSTEGSGTATTPNQPGTASLNQQDPFAALLGAAGGAGANPFANPFGAPPATTGDQQQQENPLAEMTRRLMQNPETMQSAMNMLGQMGGGAGASPFGAAATNQEAGAGNTGTSSPPPNPFAALFGPGAFGAGGLGSPPPQDNRPPEEVYEVQLRQLNEMGFYEFDRNVAALRRSGGNVQGAIEYLLSGGS